MKGKTYTTRTKRREKRTNASIDYIALQVHGVVTPLKMCLCLCMQTKHRVVVHSTTTSLRLRIYSVYSNWNVQAIKTNEVNYYCVCVCFFPCPCNRELFATFSTCQQIVYIALFSDSHTFTSLVQCQTTCLFRDVHYSPLDNVYR